MRVAFVDREQHECVAGVEAAVGLDRVVETQHGRRRAALHDAAHRVEPVGERRERERGADLGGRKGVQPEPRADDDPERSFRSDEELGQVGPDRGAR